MSWKGIVIDFIDEKQERFMVGREYPQLGVLEEIIFDNNNLILQFEKEPHRIPLNEINTIRRYEHEITSILNMPLFPL